MKKTKRERYNCKFVNSQFRNRESDIIYKLKNIQEFFEQREESEGKMNVVKRVLKQQKDLMTKEEGGKTMKALITGASSGIGKDLATILSQKGYELILVSRDRDKLEQVANELKTKTEIIPLDLSQPENCKKLHEQAPNIDLLINNAGFGDCGNFAKTDLEKEIKMIQTNITAYHILTKLYLIDFQKKNSGKILNVASIAGFMPGPLMSTYYATKAYVVRLSEGIREELKQSKSNVKISILCPGPVATNFNKVANVKFHLREANSMEVAKYTINKLEKNKFYIVPGIDIKIAKFLSKIAPNNIVSKVTYRIQKRKTENERI